MRYTKKGPGPTVQTSGPSHVTHQARFPSPAYTRWAWDFGYTLSNHIFEGFRGLSPPSRNFLGSGSPLPSRKHGCYGSKFCSRASGGYDLIGPFIAMRIVIVFQNESYKAFRVLLYAYKHFYDAQTMRTACIQNLNHHLQPASVQVCFQNEIKYGTYFAVF